MGMEGSLPEMHNILRQFQAKDQHYEQVQHEIYEEERRPMIEIPAYREKMGYKGAF